MAIYGEFRGGTSATNTSFWYDSNTYIYDSFSPTAGNLNLAGSESWVNNGGTVTNGSNIASVDVQRGGTVYVYNGSGTGYFGRNSAVGGVIYDYLGGTWSGGLCGYYYWSTVPTAPGAIAITGGGTITNNTYQTAIALTANGTYTATPSSNTKATDGGQPVTSHQAQYRVTADGKTVVGVSRSGTTVTVTTSSAHGLSAGNIVQLYGVGGTYASTVNGRWQVTGASTTQITFTTSTSGNFTVGSGDLGSALIALYSGWTGTKAVTGGTFSFTSLTAARYYQFRVYANNTNGSSAGRESASVFANPNPPAWGTKTLNTSITQSTPYSDYLNITGYTLSGNVSIKTGSIPAGLSLSTTQIDSNNARVTLSGTPSTPGSYTFTLEATNVGGSTTSPSYTLNVLSSDTVWNTPGKGSLNNADDTIYALRNEVAYNGTTGDYLYAVGAVTNGYSITSGSLPPGMTATNTTSTTIVPGSTINIYKISGTPTSSGTYSFTVQVSTGGTPITQPVSVTVRPTGKRFTATVNLPYTTSSNSTNILTLKRKDTAPGIWTDVKSIKKWNGTSWVDIDNPTA